MADVLYHYTTKEKFYEIIGNPDIFIKKAQDFSRTVNINEDIKYDDGLLFTSIAPQNYQLDRLRTILLGESNKKDNKKLEYFSVIKHENKIKQFDKNSLFYCLVESFTESQSYLMGGRTDEYAMPKDIKNLVKVGSHYLTRFEKARIVGSRALQLSFGAPPLLDIRSNLNLTYLAQLELKTRVLPIGIERKMEGKIHQTIPIQHLSDKDFIEQIDVTDDLNTFIEATQ